MSVFSFELLNLKFDRNFEYYERRMSDKQDVVSTYSMTSYPPELQKKVTLLQHFKSYLEGDKATGVLSFLLYQKL